MSPVEEAETEGNLVKEGPCSVGAGGGNGVASRQKEVQVSSRMSSFRNTDGTVSKGQHAGAKVEASGMGELTQGFQRE